MVLVEPTTCSTANCAVLGALASASRDPAELRSQYAGLVSAQHAMAVVAFNREVDDAFLTVDIDGPAVWHLTHQPPPLIVGTVVVVKRRIDSSHAQDRWFPYSPP